MTIIMHHDSVIAHYSVLFTEISSLFSHRFQETEYS